MLMCLFNHLVMKKSLPIYYNLRKSLILPGLSAIVMGGTSFGIYHLFSFLFGKFMKSEYFINMFATMIAAMFAVFIYFVVLIKSGGANENDIMRFPKGSSIVRILKMVRIL